MITNDELKRYLLTFEDVFHVEVEGDGHHYQLIVVSDVFERKTKLARQQWVYVKLNDFIRSGQLHAVNMKTWTKAEWEKQHG